MCRLFLYLVKSETATIFSRLVKVLQSSAKGLNPNSIESVNQKLQEI